MTLGCSRFSAFRRVALPLALPGVAAAAIFVFVTTWNEVFAAALLTFTNRTLPAQMLAARHVAAAVPLAGGFFLLAPALLVIFFIRKYLVAPGDGSLDKSKGAPWLRSASRGFARTSAASPRWTASTSR